MNSERTTFEGVWDRPDGYNGSRAVVYLCRSPAADLLVVYGGSWFTIPAACQVGGVLGGGAFQVWAA